MVSRWLVSFERACAHPSSGWRHHTIRNISRHDAASTQTDSGRAKRIVLMRMLESASYIQLSTHRQAMAAWSNEPAIFAIRATCTNTRYQEPGKQDDIVHSKQKAKESMKPRSTARKIRTSTRT